MAGAQVDGAVSAYEAVYAVVRQIPPGRVSTYGTVAVLAGYPRAARMVGYALAALPPQSDVPWWRVVNRLGAISTFRAAGEQQARLNAEPIAWLADERVDLRRHFWAGVQADD
jgi:methylated-DNA-protein-cysteine methyltransferase related protein